MIALDDSSSRELHRHRDNYQSDEEENVGQDYFYQEKEDDDSDDIQQEAISIIDENLDLDGSPMAKVSEGGNSMEKRKLQMKLKLEGLRDNQHELLDQESQS